MNIIIPILYVGALAALLVPRVSRKLVMGLALWALCVMLWYYIRH